MIKNWIKYNESKSSINDFVDIIKDKLLELSDIGFTAYIEDENNEPFALNFKRITIDKRRRDNKSFDFSECSESISDIVLTNDEMSLYKTIHIIITPINHNTGIRLENKIEGGKLLISIEDRPYIEISKINTFFINNNIKLRLIEIFFEA